MDSKKGQIFIAKISHTVTEPMLEKEFKKCGEIEEVRLKKGYGFIVFLISHLKTQKV